MLQRTRTGSAIGTHFSVQSQAYPSFSTMKGKSDGNPVSHFISVEIQVSFVRNHSHDTRVTSVKKMNCSVTNGVWTMMLKRLDQLDYQTLWSQNMEQIMQNSEGGFSLIERVEERVH